MRTVLPGRSKVEPTVVVETLSLENKIHVINVVACNYCRVKKFSPDWVGTGFSRGVLGI